MRAGTSHCFTFYLSGFLSSLALVGCSVWFLESVFFGVVQPHGDVQRLPWSETTCQVSQWWESESLGRLFSTARWWENIWKSQWSFLMWQVLGLWMARTNGEWSSILFGAGVEGLSWNQWPCTSWVKIRTSLDISIRQAIAGALVNRMTFFECDWKGQCRVVLPFRNWPERFSWRNHNAAGKGDWLIPVLQNLPCSVPVHGIQSVLVLGMPHVEADLMEDALLAKIHYSRPS